MSNVDPIKTIIFNPTNRSCPIGEMTGKKNMVESKIPVLSYWAATICWIKCYCFFWIYVTHVKPPLKPLYSIISKTS